MRWTSPMILTTLMMLTSCAAEIPDETGEIDDGPTAESTQAVSPTQGLLANINAGKYGPTGETLSAALFDPYFTKPKTYAYPFHPPGGAASGTVPRWICPAGEACGAQAPGTGYYSFVQDRVASDVSTWQGPALFPNTTLPAVASFNWAYRPGGIIADLRVSNTQFPQWNIPGASSPYAGLQLNLPSHFPGGMPLADQVPLSAIRYIHVRMRAAACKPPFAKEPHSSGRISYYASFGVPEASPFQLPNGSKAMELAFNLLRFASTASGQWPAGGIVEPGRARWECPDMNLFAHATCTTPTIDIDGPSWGISAASDLAFSTSETCTTQAVDALPWQDYVIDVPRALLRLFDEGFVTMDYLQNATYGGGILGGIEFFGPAAVGAQVAQHTLYVASNPQSLPVVLGNLRTQLNAADPGFLAGTNTFVYRKTLSFDGTTCPIGTLGSPCDDSIYGKICQSGGDLLRCGNGPNVSRRWNWLGSAAACAPSMAPGNACSQPGQGCRSGSDVIMCSSPPYQGPLYPGAAPQSTFYRYVDAPGSPKPTFQVNAGGSWCWFVMRDPGGPIIDTQTPPSMMGTAAGRCAWDPLAGNYRSTSNNATFYYDGGGTWCWYASTSPAPGLPLIDTNREASAFGTGGAQCSSDLGPKLAAGFYLHQPTGNRFYYNGTAAFCWFLKATGPAGEPLVSTSISPLDIGATNAGRCVWDQ